MLEAGAMGWGTGGGGASVAKVYVFLRVQPADCGLGGLLCEELIEMRGDVRVSANMAGPFVRVTSLHSHPIHLRPAPQNHAPPGD